jgi:hypothetical protein
MYLLTWNAPTEYTYIYKSDAEIKRDLETIGRRLESLKIKPPSDLQIFLDKPERFLKILLNDYPVLDTLLRALDTAREELQSHRSRADPELARHRKSLQTPTFKDSFSND